MYTKQSSYTIVNLISMQKIKYPSEERGEMNIGWLKAKYSFSFANYYDAEKLNFGVLRVLNDDLIDPGRGFETHPHDNMEIITIPLEGELAHKDSMGNEFVIKTNDIQVMSAGTGVYHSEFNPNNDQHAKILQIWIFPNKRGVEPRYEQVSYNPEAMKNNWQQLISPNKEDSGSWIHQDAWINRGIFDSDLTTSYKIKRSGNGVYLFVIDGEILINDTVLAKRDAIGIWNTDDFEITVNESCDILLLDVPMGMN